MKKLFAALRVALMLALALALAVHALAESSWELFGSIPDLVGENVPPLADTVMQKMDHMETVNDVEIRILEAGYDGRTLFLRYSFRMLLVDRPLAATAEEIYGDELPEGMDPNSCVPDTFAGDVDWESLLADCGVGWWIDNIWIDGRELQMADGSMQLYSGSDYPGEIIETDYWRLDNLEEYLSGPVQISLPIGDMQDFMDYDIMHHPEKFDENDMLILPEKGMVTFTFDAKDIASTVPETGPGQEIVLPEVTAKMRKAVFSPLLTYIWLDLEANPDLLAAYIAENGEGPLDSEGEVMWPYDGTAVFGDWLGSLVLTDGTGTVLFPDHYGLEGYDDSFAEFLYPYLDANALPNALYLAPLDDNGADLSRAVQVFPASP